MPFPRPGEPLAGGLGAGEAGEAGRRPPGEAGAGGEEPGLVGEAGAFPVLAAAPVLLLPLLPLLPVLLVLLVLLVLPVPTDESVRFKAAGPISACSE